VDAKEKVAQAERITKKKMDVPPSKVAPSQQSPPPTFIAPKATSVMENVTKMPTPKKKTQKPLSTTQRLRALSETKSEDALVFKKRKVAPLSDKTSMPQVKKVKPCQQAPTLTQPRTRKGEKRGAQRPKRLKGEQSYIHDDATNNPPSADIQSVHQQTSTVQQFERSL